VSGPLPITDETAPVIFYPTTSTITGTGGKKEATGKPPVRKRA
jgi:hypothetical protein